jgi:hypothetical protein
MEVSEYLIKLMEFNDRTLKGKVLTDSLGEFYGTITMRFRGGEDTIYGYARTVEKGRGDAIRVS